MRVTRSFLYITLALICLRCSSNEQKNESSNDVIIGSLTETGELRAVNSKVVTVPFYDWSYGDVKLLWLAEEGEPVSKGDKVAVLDTSSVKRAYLQKESDLSIAISEFRKLQVENESELKKLEADFESVKARLKQAQIDTQRVIYESKTEKESSRLRLKIAEIDLQKIQRRIEHTKIIQEQSLMIQREKIKQIQNAIGNARRTIKKFSIEAPSDGIVEYRRRRRNRGPKVQVGDEFWPGRQLVGLPDLSKMKAVTSISETDITKIKLGQKAIIRLDAYPKETFKGEIDYISITCHEKDEDSKQKVFDVEILINGTANILKPGMTVSCEILIEKTEKQSS